MYKMKLFHSLYSCDGCLVMRTDTDNRIIQNDNFIELNADSLDYSEASLTRIYEKERRETSFIEEFIGIDTAGLYSAS